MKRLAALALLLTAAAPPADREQAVEKTLRCVVCQNQSIADSDAALAADLRGVVRQRLAAGDSDDQVRAYVAARYGRFVLLDPPFEADTWALWLGPFVVLGAGGYAVWRVVRRPPSTRPPGPAAPR